MGTPSTSTSARLAPLAPSPRSETPCDVGFAVWLPERRSKLESRHLAQLVVGGERPPLLELLVGYDDGIRLRFNVVDAGGKDRGARGRDVEALLHRSRNQRDGERLVAGGPGHGGGGES